MNKSVKKTLELNLSFNCFDCKYLMDTYYNAFLKNENVAKFITNYRKSLFMSLEDLNRFENKHLIELDYVRQEHKAAFDN